MSYWEHKPREEKMGIDTTIFDTAMQPCGLTKEELLAREAIQNCKDAAETNPSDGKKKLVTIEIERKTLSGSSKKEFFKALSLNDQKNSYPRIHDQKRAGEMKKFIQNDEPLSILTISDYGTVGLGGNWKGRAQEDNYSHLVINIAYSGKTTGGGSYGFGKTVYPKHSRLRLVIYYSHFKSVLENDQEVNSRFGALWLLDCDDENSGFGFFGQHNPERINTSMPFTNEEAHMLAQKCGIKKRENGDYGTTIAVVDCDVDLQKIRYAAEKYWWPSIHDGLISIKFIDEGEQTVMADPLSNDLTKIYWEIYDLLQVGQGSLPEGTVRDVLYKTEGINKGVIAYKPVPEDAIMSIKDLEKEMGFDPEIDGICGVARIRESAGMVLSYDKTLIKKEKPLVAIFIGHKDVDSLLRSSENPAHNLWDHSATDRIANEVTRLNKKNEFNEKIKILKQKGIFRSNFDFEFAARLIKSINDSITSKIKQIVSEQKAPPPPDSAKMKSRERLLGRFLNSGKIPPPVEERILSITKGDPEIVVEGLQRKINVPIVVKISSCEKTKDITSVEIKIHGVCNVLGDTKGKVVDERACIITDSDKKLVEAHVELKKGEKAKFVASTSVGLKEVVRIEADCEVKKINN